MQHNGRIPGDLLIVSEIVAITRASTLHLLPPAHSAASWQLPAQGRLPASVMRLAAWLQPGLAAAKRCCHHFKARR